MSLLPRTMDWSRPNTYERACVFLRLEPWFSAPVILFKDEDERFEDLVIAIEELIGCNKDST